MATFSSPQPHEHHGLCKLVDGDGSALVRVRSVEQLYCGILGEAQALQPVRNLRQGQLAIPVAVQLAEDLLALARKK